MNFYQRMGILPLKKRVNCDKCSFNKTAYVWGLPYRWDPSLSMNPVRRFTHFMPPCTGLFWTVLDCTGLYWAVLGSSVLCWKWKIVQCSGRPKTPILHWQSQLRREYISDIAGIISRISNIFRQKYPEPKRKSPSQLWMVNKNVLQIKLQSTLNIQNIWNF